MAALGLLSPYPISKDTSTSPPPALRVLQWNILADGLAQSGQFSRVDKQYLEWSYRAPRLLHLILQHQPHVICLQELNHFDDFFLPNLKHHGYDGEFFQKPGVVAKKSEFPMDGCAIFYNTSRLQLLGVLADTWQDVVSVASEPCYLADHIVGVNCLGGQICRFRDVEANEDVVIVNTHLKAKDGDVNENLRVTQIRQLLQRLGTLTQGSSVATIFCGDLNADPFSKTYSIVSERLMGVYSLTSPCEAPHPVGLTESCNGTVSKGSAQTEPPFTTWKFRFNEAEKHRTIDYIWYNSESKLVPYKRWTLPSKAAIGVDALPSALYPSDHLSLLCEFRWRDSGFI